MIEISDEVILLTDSSKFDHVSYSVVAPVGVLDKVITDSGIKPRHRAALEERGIAVTVVEAMTEIIPGT
jgi:DeoR/GlpR family transcriptional regulator of sugar metabolism